MALRPARRRRRDQRQPRLLPQVPSERLLEPRLAGVRRFAGPSRPARKCVEPMVQTSLIDLPWNPLWLQLAERRMKVGQKGARTLPRNGDAWPWHPTA